MNRNSKIWTTTDTGMKYHAFPVKGGGALCRKNIKARMLAESSDFFRSLDYIREMFTTSDVCTSCEAKMLTHEAFIDSEQAIALAMNEEFDAKAAPAACCDHAPMYHGARGCDQCGCATPRSAAPACIRAVVYLGHYVHAGTYPLRAKAAPACICYEFGSDPSDPDVDHHIVCPLRANDTDSKETNDVSIKTGPLTERQISILVHLRAGKRHEEIVSLLEEGSTVNVVKQECQNIRAKFRTNTVTQAVSLWATAQAYRETATLIGSHRPTHPDNETDVHVDHVLYGLMQILRERADRLTPQ